MELTDDHIEKGYWYFRPAENFPPPAKLISEYQDEERLWLILSRGNETYGEVKKREKDYPSAILEKLTQTKILWTHQINQETFDAITQLKGVTSLSIDSNRVKNLAGISKLKQLRHLALLNMTKVDSIEEVSELRNLKTLKLEHFKKINDFSSISELTILEGLQIDGDMYTAQKIQDFKFLRTLNLLRYLTLTNTRAIDKNMDAFRNLLKLEMFQCSANYPIAEFNKLKDLPNLKFIGGNVTEKINKNANTVS